MSCYYHECQNKGRTKEHIPPRSFFPANQRNQLLTVKSCEEHNNAKSSDDIYVLAHICMSASPSNGARDIFLQRVAPQLKHNGEALRKLLAAGAVPLSDGAVAYKVDVTRFDRFFSALSCGIIYNSCKARLPPNYTIGHVYHDFHDEVESEEEAAFKKHLLDFYSGEPMTILDFGHVKALNTTVYSAKIIGIPDWGSSITIVHRFFGTFRVTSMLTRIISDPQEYIGLASSRLNEES
ncbi:hypothetical protein WME75_35515 [Sorangium sp. So ce1014]|uniref:hypothetical protein n=1 Tax=Sorangium sp. So ce1014 TaxID=3133326 RepID=UPI003F63BA93